jgi:hypothetical protein
MRIVRIVKMRIVKKKLSNNLGAEANSSASTMKE